MPASPANQTALARIASARYQQSQTHTVSPGQLVIMLYDGAIRFARQAQAAMREQRIELAHQLICKVQAILTELDGTLRDDTGAVATNLHGIYGYCLQRLLDANIRKDPAMMEDVIAFLETLAASWRDAVQRVECQGQPGLAEGVQVTLQ